MAKNVKFPLDNNTLELTVISGVVSGDPVVVGQIPGVALTDRSAPGVATGKAVVQIGSFVANLTVEGANNAGNVAVAEGDILYYDTAATIKINKDNTNGVRFGYALAALSSGANGVIPVLVGY